MGHGTWDITIQTMGHGAWDITTHNKHGTWDTGHKHHGTWDMGHDASTEQWDMTYISEVGKACILPAIRSKLSKQNLYHNS